MKTHPHTPDSHSTNEVGASDLTTVELLWLEKRIENRVRFGRPVSEKVVDRNRRVLSFAPGSIFAFVRWTSNDFGTVLSRIDILRAATPGQRYSTVPWINPGGEILLRLSGWPKVERVAPDELYSTDHHNVADGLTTLPQDYAAIPRDVPRLGPPLPGDLGRPIVTAEGQSAPIGLDGEQQRVNQETEAARTSKIFVSTTAPVAPPHVASQESATKTAPSSDETFTQNGQDSKLLFVNAPVDRRTTAPDRLSRPASPFVLQAGTIIPAALITGIRSDLPGQITAQVTESIFDSPTGRIKLVPQGARLIGVYDSQIAFGQ